MSVETTYRVRFTDIGQVEYNDAVSWYAEQSPDTAQKWVAGFEQAVIKLEYLPTIHPIAPETVYFERTVRRLLYRQFRVLFHVMEPYQDEEFGTVYVLAVRHTAAQPWTASEEE